MTNTELADALDRIAIREVGPLYLSERADISAAAHALRRLGRVEEAAEAYRNGSHGDCDNPDIELTCRQHPGEALCSWCQFDEAMDQNAALRAE